MYNVTGLASFIWKKVNDLLLTLTLFRLSRIEHVHLSVLIVEIPQWTSDAWFTLGVVGREFNSLPEQAKGKAWLTRCCMVRDREQVGCHAR